MTAPICPEITYSTLLACMLAAAKKHRIPAVCGVKTELCETINDLDELMAIETQHAIESTCAGLNVAIKQQILSQPAART